MNLAALQVFLNDDSETHPTVTPDWVSLETAPIGGDAFEGWDPVILLGWNATLPSNAKFVLGRGSLVRVRVEYPRYLESSNSKYGGEQIDSGAPIAQVQKLWDQPEPKAEIQSLPVGGALSDRLVAAASGCGWEVNKREDALVANLEVPGGFLQAQIVSTPSGESFAVVEIVSLDKLGETARQAIAHMLLRAGAGIRWARPALRIIGDKTVAVFEITLAVNPEEIADCLRALSIAGRMTVDEANALADENFASDYLEAVNPICNFEVRV